MVWPVGSWCRRCCWPTRATARSASSAGGWTPARFPMWWRSGPTPRPTQSMSTPPLRRTRARAAVPGQIGSFRWGLAARQIPYVVEVRADTSAYSEHVHSTAAPYTGKGRRPRPRYRDRPCSLAQLALQAGQQACVELIWRRGSKGLQRGRFLALRVRPAGVTPRRLARQDGGELPVRWLLVEWPLGKAEPSKYWLSGRAEGTRSG